MGPANFRQFCRNKKGFCHMINLVENSLRGKSLNARCQNSITTHRHFLEAFAMHSNNYECKMSLHWTLGWSYCLLSSITDFLGAQTVICLLYVFRFTRI